MKFAFSTNAFKKFTLTEAIRSIAQTGYQGAEIMCDRPHAYPPDLTPDSLKEFKKLLKGLNLSISNLNTFMLCALGDMHHPSWIEPTLEERAKRVQHTINCINLAAELGVPTISTEPGGPEPEKSAFLSTEKRNNLLKIFKEELAKVIPLAEKRKIKILIEPEPDLLIERSEQLEEFLKWFRTPALGINFDLGHFFCVGEDPAELIKKWGNRIDHIHLEDIADNRKHQHLLPGTGAIDFPKIFRALKEINYQGWVTVELYPYQESPVETAKKALEFLNRGLC